MPDCLFCKIINHEIPANIVYEDDLVLAFLDINPNNEGHTLVVPKKHFDNLLDAENEYLSAIITTVHKIAPGILKSVRADSFNLHVNSGETAGQVVPHLHFHIIPRFQNDSHELFKGQPMDAEKLKQTAQKIKTNL